jgi:hypothetical protein
MEERAKEIYGYDPTQSYSDHTTATQAPPIYTTYEEALKGAGYTQEDFD